MKRMLWASTIALALASTANATHATHALPELHSVHSFDTQLDAQSYVDSLYRQMVMPGNNRCVIQKVVDGKIVVGYFHRSGASCETEAMAHGASMLYSFKKR